MSSDGLLFHRQGKWFAPSVALLFLIFALEMFLSARLESQTFDEPAHLYAGYSYWLRSDFGINPEHPPLVKLVASLPLLLDKPKYPDPPPMYFRAVSAIGGVQLLGPPVPEGEEAVAIDPDSLYAHETLSEVYAAVHRPDDAIRDYHASMQLFARVDPAFADDVGGPPENPLAPPP